jgi:hypothetical protein
LPGVVDHACPTSTGDAEAEIPQVQGQLQLYSKTVSKNNVLVEWLKWSIYLASMKSRVQIPVTHKESHFKRKNKGKRKNY